MRLANLFALLLLNGCGCLPAGAIDPAGKTPPPSAAEEPGLAELVRGCGIPDFGTVIEGPLDEREYLATLLREYNTAIVGEAMRWLHPDRDRYDFTRLDKKLQFAEGHGMTIYSHLLWHPLQHVPRWFVDPILRRDLGESYLEEAADKATMVRRAIRAHPWTAEERAGLITILENYVSTVVGRYRGRVAAWAVVNEPIHPRPQDVPLRNSLWLAAIGPEYIEIALRAARRADPEARLYLNDFGIEGLGAKSDAFFSLVGDLKSRAVPLDAVGLQMHIKLTGYPHADEVRANIKRLARLGLEVYITELDVAIEEPATRTELAAQAARYQEILQVCLSEPGCRAFFTWGFTDKYSWIPEHEPGFGDALIFDKSYRPKPAYFAMKQALRNCQ